MGTQHHHVVTLVEALCEIAVAAIQAVFVEGEVSAASAKDDPDPGDGGAPDPHRRRDFHDYMVTPARVWTTPTRYDAGPGRQAGRRPSP